MQASACVIGARAVDPAARVIYGERVGDGKVVAEVELPGGRRFVVVLGDLLAEPVDAIVNAANGHLLHGGGVAAAIARAAGPALEQEGERIVREQGPVPTGGAVVTTAGRLPFQGVIHAVGPRLGEGDEEGKLVRALLSSFTRAHERGWRSVAFPAVSAGIFAVPPEVCARSYLRAAREYFGAFPESSLEALHLVLLAGPLVEAVRAELDGSAQGRGSGRA
jgi:O-acetyl-ADP-ribose deacetylase